MNLAQEMSVTEKLIRDLKRSINPITGEGWTYAEIAGVIGISKQGAIQHVQKQASECPSCLRKLRRRRNLTVNQTKKEHLT